MKLQWLLCLAAFILVGCRPPLEVDLSPSGDSVAMATSAELAINPVGDSPAKVVYRGETSYPKWSPDGSRLAFLGNGCLRIYDLGTGRTMTLPRDLNLPFAWNAEGAEIYAFNPEARRLEVYHLASKEVVRKVELPFIPTDVATAPQGRGFAVANSSALAIWRDGKLHEIDVPEGVSALAYRSGDELAILGGFPYTEETETVLPLMQWDPSGGVQKLRDLKLTEILGAGGRRAWPTYLKFSPDGDELGILGLVDNSPPGVLAKLMELEETGDEVGAERLSGQVRFNVVFSSLNLTSSKSQAQLVSENVKFFEPAQVSWSADGELIALVSGENVKLVQRPGE